VERGEKPTPNPSPREGSPNDGLPESGERLYLMGERGERRVERDYIC